MADENVGVPAIAGTIDPMDMGMPTPEPMYLQDYIATDDWGRKWMVTVQTKTRDMVGYPSSVHWTEPLSIPGNFMRIDPSNPNRLIIEYEGWALFLETKHLDWTSRLYDEGKLMYKEAFDPDKPTSYLLHEVGKKPMDPAIPRAAAAGDPKYLGVEPQASHKDLEAENKALRERLAKLEKPRNAEGQYVKEE